MNIIKNLVDKSKYNIKCPYEMEAEFYIVHNTANDASARNEVAYMKRNENKVSFHYAIDDIEVVQGIEENRNSYNAGDGVGGRGNRKGIAIEICYSKSGGEKWEKAKRNAIKFIAEGLKEKGWGIEKVKKHQDFNGKYCPHRILDEGWDNFINEIKKEIGQNVQEVVSTNDYITVEQWQKTMNYCYNCKLEVDNSFGPDSQAKANKYYLYYKKPTIKNLHVEFIQDALIRKGYRVQRDRSFGPEMDRVIRQFQKEHGLAVDGCVGANTTRELLK